MQVDTRNIFEKFFFYHRYPNGSISLYKGTPLDSPYTNWYQLTWLILTPILCFFLYRYVRKYPQSARKIIVVFSILMLITRLYIHLIPSIFGDQRVLEIPPWHHCAISTFLMAIVALFNVKWAKDPVYVLGFMGGIVTLTIGEVFENSFVNFNTVSSMISHSLLIMIPLVEIASGTWRFDLKRTHIVIATLFGYMAWATLANKVLLARYDKNYMYLQESGLPGGFGGRYYFLVYILIFIVLYCAIFAPFYFYRWLQSRKN